ncbi:tripartite motif-containing protein 16-like [Seriola lalandi dorsalis]|uniref:tripartite motif-containing protein 16-like n=1 Tax=Seriola lalandi dorsalis TaxID=1841481 RepID=UPI000C6F8582|nr:tripartite motif-containing protein 16-like [Seriola lalandi dorsalis]XP_056254310.1 tripartite motif-containing protein 16-like [Seriola aureovittata]
MAQQLIQLDQEKLSCSICLDLLKEPVTIPCGHSYCMSCIKTYWDEDDQKKTHSCPQCRQSFTPRPALVRNTMFAELVEELKKVGLQAASPDHFYAGPGDVACDFCTGRKLKAFKSCLMCLASYCEQHLQPHYDVGPLKKHMLVEATSKLLENICSRHNEVMKIFCRTDQKCICYLCSMDEHKGHDTVSAVAERAEKQTELGVSRQKIQRRIQSIKKDVKVLQQEVEAINISSDEAVSKSEKIFTDLIRLIEERRSEVKQQIRSHQKTEVSRITELEEKLQQEITELRRKDTDLAQLSHTEDHSHFLNNYSSLSHLSEATRLPSINPQSQQYIKDVTAAVSRVRDKLLAVLNEEWGKVSLKNTGVDILPQHQEPQTRSEFLKYARQITLDPITANTFLSLSKRNRKVTLMHEQQVFWIHPEQFFKWWQVLSKEGLTGRCYWEVKWSGKVLIAVAYRDIRRMGTRSECGFGYNDKSWALECYSGSYTFIHNGNCTSLSGPPSSRIGVYLDHRAGTLSFYSVSRTMNLLLRVQTTFTQPLYPGLWLLGSAGDTAELC